MLHAMIMAGGGGTRFWPRSRQARPKQFLTLTGDRTLLQLAYDRLEPLSGAERLWVITGEDYREETARQTGLPDDRIIGEPCGRDTAPCVGLGAALVAERDPDAVMIVTPADHLIEPVREFVRAAQVAEQTAREYPDCLITFGIPPNYPATGYGYIQRGQTVAERQGIRAFRVEQFHEKPLLEKAQAYLASGDYYWNSGIFVWKASAILDQLRQHTPELHDAVRRIARAWDTPRRQEVLQAEYPGLTKISIDKAVMEPAGKAGKVMVVQTPYRWDDVGSWLALERVHPQDAGGNTVLADHEGINTRNCVVVSDSGHLIATIGVENLLIIQDGNVTLVADRREEATVKDMVEALRKKKRDSHL